MDLDTIFQVVWIDLQLVLFDNYDTKLSGFLPTLYNFKVKVKCLYKDIK